MKNINKQFITIFDRAMNVHLVKDVGQIPYHMFKLFGYKSTLITCKNEDEYDYLKSEVKGINIEFISKLKIFNINLSVIIYLLKNSKNIDILNQYHIRYYTLIYSWIYKKLNKNGISYIKADVSEKHLLTNGLIYKRKLLKYITVLEKILFFFTKEDSIDFISVETKNGISILRQEYPEIYNKFIYIPNGIDSEKIEKMYNDKTLQYIDKENIILYIGRIGTIQKNTTLFLDVLKAIDLSEWEVHLIGNIEKEFEVEINKFYASNSLLKSKVFFHGNIQNRVQILEYYLKSKIFCSTSLWEGFALVFPEALYFGNYIVSTNVSGVADITCNGMYGNISKDFTSEEYSKTLSKSMDLIINHPELFEAIQVYSNKNFTWKLIVQNLQKAIEGNNIKNEY